MKLLETSRSGGNWITLLANAQARNIPVAMNGGFFDNPNNEACDPDLPTADNAVGYFYGVRSDSSLGYISSLRLTCSGTVPMLAITDRSGSPTRAP